MKLFDIATSVEYQNCQLERMGAVLGEIDDYFLDQIVPGTELGMQRALSLGFKANRIDLLLQVVFNILLSVQEELNTVSNALYEINRNGNAPPAATSEASQSKTHKNI